MPVNITMARTLDYFEIIFPMGENVEFLNVSMLTMNSTDLCSVIFDAKSLPLIG